MITHFLLILFSTLGTYHLSQVKNLGPIFSSAVITIFSCIFLFSFSSIIPSDLSQTDLYKICFGASFIGMSSPKFFTRRHIIFAGFIFFFLFKYISIHIQDLAGALGFLAFISVGGAKFVSIFFKHLTRSV